MVKTARCCEDLFDWMTFGPEWLKPVVVFEWSAVHMNMEFTGVIVFWKGPAPWYFIAVPEAQSRDLKAISGSVTYGWGVIPVHVRIGKTEWQTSLFPKDDRYLVPIKASVRKAENLKEGDTVALRLEVR